MNCMVSGLANVSSWQQDFNANLHKTLKLFFLCFLLLTISAFRLLVSSSQFGSH